MGRGAVGYRRALVALPTGQNIPVLTPSQQRFLDCDVVDSRSIDHTLKRINNWGLQGEIQRFRTLRARVAILHEDALHTRRALATATQALQASTTHLSRSDTFVRIQQALEDEEDEFVWLATADLRTALKKVARSPLDPADTYCCWCQHKGHDEVDCWIFQQCCLCTRFGHVTEDCRSPHRFCSVTTGCDVPLDHSEYHRKPNPEWSTLVPTTGQS